MRLIRHGEKTNEKPGVEIDGQRYDCSKYFRDWNADFFRSDGLTKLKKVISKSFDQLEKVAPSERWASPIGRPGMILCVGLNYSDHAKESGMDIPKEPILFMKASNTIAGPYDNVTIPKNSTKTDWEVELGIVISRDVSYLNSKAQGAEAIAGYCVVNDLSERSFQLERSGQWVKGKSCPGFSPIGPSLVTTEDVTDILNLKMQLSVNDKKMQNGSTSTMIFDPAYIVYYVSQFMTLEAGDLISTGTPPGVGLGMSPPTYLKAGDIVSLEIESLGQQRQKMVGYVNND